MFWVKKCPKPLKNRKINNLSIFEYIKLSYYLGFSILHGYLKNCKNGCGKTFCGLWDFWCFFGEGTFFSQNSRIRLRKFGGCGDFSEKSPRLKGHNFRATESFLKSRHSRNIYWLQFVDFCGDCFFLVRLRYPAVHLPDVFFRKMPCTALV